jgi:hypothetical protein
LLRAARKRKVDIIAAEQEMLAYRGTLEANLAAAYMDSYQAEIGSAAADIAYQDEIAVFQPPLERAAVVYHPCIEGGERLFEQCQVCYPGISRGFDRKLARLFIEGSRHGKDYLLALEAPFILVRAGAPKPVIPCVAYVAEVSRRRLDRRAGEFVLLCAPGQNPRRAVDGAVREPGLCRRDLTARHKRPLLAREDPYNRPWGLIPGQAPGSRQFMLSGEI